LGGRDQEDPGSRPAHANSSWDLHLQNNQRKIDWKCGSSCRTTALQAWSPEFKSLSHQKKKEKLGKLSTLVAKKLGLQKPVNTGDRTNLLQTFHLIPHLFPEYIKNCPYQQLENKWLNKKQARDLNRNLTKENIWMSSNDVKSYRYHLLFEKCKLKPPWATTANSSEGLKLKRLITSVLARMRGPEPLKHSWWNVKLYTHFGKHSLTS
jgi:hypothetical protein